MSEFDEEERKMYGDLAQAFEEKNFEEINRLKYECFSMVLIFSISLSPILL